MSELHTNIDDITERRILDGGTRADTPLFEGDVLLKIQRFAFTANNVTYGAVGERIGYWQFFPPTGVEGDSTRWGIIPVWGYAEVINSAHPEIETGERVYGYLPMAEYWVMRPGRISAGRWIDVSEHRRALPAVYNSYQRLPGTDQNTTAENLASLLMPLYGTSFCLCDALASKDYHGAKQVLIISASSKTSLGLAYGLSQLPAEQRPSIVGVTSSGNADFVRSVGLYDSVVTYDALDAVDTGTPAALVDMSGNRKTLSALHQMLGDNMRWCDYVGLTHLDGAMMTPDGDAPALIDERSAMFFAPGHIEARTKELGADEWNRRMTAFTNGAIGDAAKWLAVREVTDLSSFLPVYDAMVAGDVNAREGLIVTP